MRAYPSHDNDMNRDDLLRKQGAGRTGLWYGGSRPFFAMVTLITRGQFAVLDVEGFPVLRHWYAVYPAGRQLSVVARAFLLDYLRGILRLLRRAKENTK